MSSKITIFIFPRANENKARYSRKRDVIEAQQRFSHKFVGPQRQIADVAP